MRLIIFIILLVFVFPYKAYALSCSVPSGKGLIQSYDVAFRGTAKSTHSNKNIIEKLVKKSRRGFDSYTTFDVSEVIKGTVGPSMNIYHTVKSPIGGSKKFDKGEEYIIFARKNLDDANYSVGVCTPLYKISQLKQHMHRSYSDTLVEIEKYQGLKQGLDKLINEYGSEGYYIEKADLLEDYKDYQQAKTLYEELFGKAYEVDKQAVIDVYKEHPNAAHGVKNRYKLDNKTCTGIYAAKNNSPYFLKEFPAPVKRGHYSKSNTKHFLAYGRILFNLGDYEAALRPLCLVGRNKEAEHWKVQALVKLGLTEEINNRSINFSEASLEDFDLSNLNIERSDLSNSVFRKIKLNNTNLTGSDFTGAKLQRVEATSANFSGSKFLEAQIDGDLSYSDLSYVKAGNSFFERNLTGANLEGADFSSAKISSDLSGANLKDANFTNAYIYKLAGAKLDNTNLDGVSSRFGQFPFPTSDYSAVNLSGYDYANSDFSDTNFAGAKFVNANLTNANLKGSNFKGVDFSGANLEGADFSSLSKKFTDLSDANLETATIKNTRLASALYNCKTVFPKGFSPEANLLENVEGSCGGENTVEEDYTIESLLLPPHRHYRLMKSYDLQKIKEKITFSNNIGCKWLSWKHTGNIPRKKMDNQDLTDRDFSGCEMGYADFSGSTLKGANFKGTYLYSANFETANIDGALFDGARITRSTKLPANFDAKKYKLVPTSVLNAQESPWQASYLAEGRDYMRTYKPPEFDIPNFSGENLDELNYTAAWLPGSDMSSASLRLTDFTASNLKGASFKDTDLTGAVFYNALLDNADFTNAKLYGADFRWARLTGATLVNADLTNAIYDNTTEWPKEYDPQKAGAFLKGPKDKPEALPGIPEDDKFNDLAEETKVYALGVYEGTHESGECGHGYDLHCTIDVTISKKGSPLFLVISSYEPTTWNIKIDPEVRLEGVLVSGMYKQEVFGIPGSIKVVNYSARDMEYDRKFFVYQKDKKQYPKMEKVTKALTGKAIDSFQGKYEIGSFIIE